MTDPNLKPPPTVFISYSHDTKDHKAWVADLGRRLREKGVEVVLDQWDTELGDDMPKFMERGVSDSDRVLMICTEPYVRKVDDGKGGAGYEAMIVTAELVRDQGLNKFIPILRQTAERRTTPTCLGIRKYVDLSVDRNFEDGLQELLETIHKVVATRKPPLGPNPFQNNTPSPQKQKEQNALAAQFIDEFANPLTAYSTAKRLIEARDHSSWRRLVLALATLSAERLVIWKTERQPSAPPSISQDKPEPVWEYVAEGVNCYDPLLACLVAAAESNDRDFSGQLGWIDLVLEPKGWEKSGNTFWTEFPRTILYTLHTRIGSVLMQSGAAEQALKLLTTPIRDPYSSSNAVPIYLTHGLMGWQEVFGTTCCNGWGVLEHLVEKTAWLKDNWQSEDTQRASLASYFMLATFLEFCREAARADRAFTPENWQLDVPQDYCRLTEPLRAGYTLLIDQRSFLLRILEKNGITEAQVRETWPKWFTAIQAWLSQVYRRYGLRGGSLPHKALADDLYRDPLKL